MLIIRSLLFDGLFYVLTFLYLLICAPIMLLSSRTFAVKFFRSWTRGTLIGLKAIVGLSYKVEGANHLKTALKNGPCLIACKHQSAWETLVFSILVDDFQIVLKRQLTYIPLFNLYLKKLNGIVVDRNGGAQSIKDLLYQARSAINNGRSILIFPEGTRSKPGEAGVYQSGIAALYRNLNVPVVPVALNAGFFWGRRSLIKKAGQITIKFLEPLPLGLSRTEFMTCLQETIETACRELEL